MTNPLNVPLGYCQCGCGRKTKLATKTSNKNGRIKGEPLKYISGHHSHPDDDFVARFWSKVDVCQENECWNWQAGKNDSGYGVIKINGKQHLAHRLSYELEYSKHPGHLCVCHHCDNPSCVNPSHLFLGTHQDNAIDRERKGRRRIFPLTHNEYSALHKLTNKQVAEIREKYAQGNVTYDDLGKEYGVSETHIGRIVRKVQRSSTRELPE